MTNRRPRPRFAAALLAIALGAGVARARDDGGRNAVIVLLGSAGDSQELAVVIGELLQRRDIGARFVRQQRLDTGDLLAGNADRAVRVFVELRDTREAALYFRGPDAQRYLLRRLELRDGLDEVGRELIAQVVESSADSLLRSSEGMTRAEMRDALARDRARSAAAASSSPGVAPPKSPPSNETTSAPAAPPTKVVATAARPPDRHSGRWNAWIGARYTYSWGGPDLGPGHGPGLELGIQRGDVTRLGLRFSAERWFTQAVPTTNVDTDLQTSQLCLLLDVARLVSARQGFSFGVGGGVEATRVTPGMVYDPAVAATAPQQQIAPIARGELRYELGGATWRLAAVLLADVSIYDTHYDVTRGGITERAATPWRVRPGGALVLAWRPAWGEK